MTIVWIPHVRQFLIVVNFNKNFYLKTFADSSSLQFDPNGASPTDVFLQSVLDPKNTVFETIDVFTAQNPLDLTPINGGFGVAKALQVYVFFFSLILLTEKKNWHCSAPIVGLTPKQVNAHRNTFGDNVWPDEHLPMRAFKHFFIDLVLLPSFLIWLVLLIIWISLVWSYGMRKSALPQSFLLIQLFGSHWGGRYFSVGYHLPCLLACFGVCIMETRQ